MKYTRMTEKTEKGFYKYKCTKEDKEDCLLMENCGECYGTRVVCRLGELEDKIEQGTLVELKKGKWLNSEKAFTSFVCSECGGEPMYSPDKNGKAYITITEFCPSCGAKMDFTEEDEEETENA